MYYDHIVAQLPEALKAGFIAFIEKHDGLLEIQSPETDLLSFSAAYMAGAIQGRLYERERS